MYQNEIREEEFEDTDMSGAAGYQLNEQVNQELMQHQMNKGNPIGFNRLSNNPSYKNMKGMNNSQQREFEEAMELDRILEEERRQQSMQAFAAQTDQKYESYLN